MKNLTRVFASKVFTDEKMKKHLSEEIFLQFKQSIEDFKVLSPEIADEVAKAMKDWAIENGATHFTHWFQPMTGITAEKHDSFLKVLPDGKPLVEFSGKELVKGEPDASSFPSGGLRETFEARGYTAWDPMSCAFIKNNSLYIPTLFFSYSGDVLDEKTPLLKSMQILNTQALRLLQLLGNTTVSKINAVVGVEQEYFLIDKTMYDRRKDLIFCGRTLFGMKSVKGQVLEDHYFASLKPRVAAFMQEMETKLWELGVPIKTKHNEVAPSQHEFAQLHTFVNNAVNQNQLVMELLKSTAEAHGLVCLLHEKPFESINGSGKHNNWSLLTDTGENLFEPGELPQENIQFLLFLCAVIKAIDEYADLMRISIAVPGNDHRLGAQEAPPAIVSIFVGDEILKILETLENGNVYNTPTAKNIESGLNIMPNFSQDTSDRNRTSPFAFTGNKFEFRMVGSSQSIAFPNTVLNTIVADALKYFSDALESCEDIPQKINELLAETIKNHKKVIFNGNSYSEGWLNEAKNRELFNLKTLPNAFEKYLSEKNVNLFETYQVFSKKELMSRFEIGLKNYCKIKHIEALTLLDMIRREVLPSINSYSEELARTIHYKTKAGKKISRQYETETLLKMTEYSDFLCVETENLEFILGDGENYENITKRAKFYKKNVVGSLLKLRAVVNNVEKEIANAYWILPSYDDILYSV